jgi:phosphohistidine swiveling domain-containing protein
MERVENLFDKIKHDIIDLPWYRQRFDACPHFMCFIGHAHVSAVAKSKYPFGQKTVFTGFSKNRADWYHSQNELEETAQKIIEMSKANSNIGAEIINEYKGAEDGFYELCSRIKSTNLSDLADDELLKLYKDLELVYIQKLIPSPLIDGFSLTTDKLIKEKIEAFLRSKNLHDRFNEYIAILTAPIFTSFLQEEEINFFDSVKNVLNDEVGLAEAIERHQQKYFWIQNNYTNDNILPVEYFASRVSDMTIVSANDRIRELTQLAIEHKRAKEELVKQLDLPEGLLALLAITDSFNSAQDERKKGTFWATHYFSLLLEEISKRTEYSLQQLKYTSPAEIADVFEKKISHQELDARFEYCMILWHNDQYDVTTDQHLIQEWDKIGTGAYAQASSVKGMTASRGSANGRVKIVESVDEISKVENGDIIVAVMTRPDYLPAMQKAVAFVTDEGGITCHAAIVAREMRKPCVIGTKSATKIFKDGDLVEVDADKGIVTIISRAN